MLDKSLNRLLYDAMRQIDLPTASQYLSQILRNPPDAIKLKQDSRGWANIDHLIEVAEIPLTRPLVIQVISAMGRHRFAISHDGLCIRAGKHHALAADLGLTFGMPPETLYHSTARKNLDAIMSDGLLPGNKQHVKLLANHTVAARAGNIDGGAEVITVAAGAAMRAGHPFWLSDDGGWLTTRLPAMFLSHG